MPEFANREAMAQAAYLRVRATGVAETVVLSRGVPAGQDFAMVVPGDALMLYAEITQRPRFHSHGESRMQSRPGQIAGRNHSQRLAPKVGGRGRPLIRPTAIIEKKGAELDSSVKNPVNRRHQGKV